MHFTVVVPSFPQIPYCLDKEKPSDVPRGEVWVFKLPIESSIYFQLCMHKKYCPSSAPVFMKFKNFVQENVKICTGPNLGTSALILDALAPPILYNSWSTSYHKKMSRISHQNGINAIKIAVQISHIFMLKMHQINNSVHTFHISLAITHTETLCHCTVISADNKIVPSMCTATHTLCGYWCAGLAWLRHEWRWTHRWNDQQNCALAPVVTWPIREITKLYMLSDFSQ